MGFFDDICNRCWCEELECACGNNIVLFCADQSTYYGLLDRVDDGIVYLLPASNERSVLVLTSGCAIVCEQLAYIDICNVVAISKNVVESPFCGKEECCGGDKK